MNYFQYLEYLSLSKHVIALESKRIGFDGQDYQTKKGSGLHKAIDSFEIKRQDQVGGIQHVRLAIASFAKTSSRL